MARKPLWFVCLLVMLEGRWTHGSRRIRAKSTDSPLPNVASNQVHHQDASIRTAGQGSFLWLSDLHLDPLYGTAGAYGLPELCQVSSPAFGRYGCDTPQALLERALTAARVATSSGQGIDFVLLTGDFVRHNVSSPYSTFSSHMKPQSGLAAIGIMQQAMEMVLAAFPPAPTSPAVVPVLGNNDLQPSNHLTITTEVPFTSPGKGNSHPYLSRVASMWLLKGALLSNTDESFSFSHGGYYTRLISPGHLRLIILNTPIYSNALSPPNHLADPFGQFAWMRTQLLKARAAGERVYLVGHNPPSMQAYRPGEPCWKELYVQAYSAISREFADVVAAHLYGHTHSGEIRTPLGELAAPQVSQNSIVPTGKGGEDPSNPAFSVCRYDGGTKNIREISLYSTDLSNTSSVEVEFQLLIPSIVDALQLPNLSCRAIQQLSWRMGEDDVMWARYWDGWYKAGVHQPDCTGSCRHRQLCLMRNPWNEAAYASCAARCSGNNR